MRQLRLIYFRKHLWMSVKALVAGRGWSMLMRRIFRPDGETIMRWSFFVMRETCHPKWVEHIRNKEIPVVVDVGANVGVFVDLIRSMNPKCDVRCIEPNPWMEHILQAKANHVFQVAVSDTPRHARLKHAGPFDTNGSITSGWLCSPKATDSLVKVTTLDKLFPFLTVDLMKIDCQGEDMRVIGGGRSLLKRTRYLILESDFRPDVDGFRVVEKVGVSDWFLENELLN